MRALLGVAVAILGLAAWIVPLPLQVAWPGRVVPAQPQVTVAVSQQYVADASLRLDPVSGEFFSVAQRTESSLAQVAAAAVAPSADVLAAPPRPQVALEQPGVIAAVLGLGLSPVRLEGAGLPVEVTVGGGVDAASVGVALLAFDETSSLDVARNRRVLGVGAMAADQQLICTGRVAPSVAAAQQAGLDVLVVPADCAPDLVGVETSRGDLTVIVAGTLIEAVDALLAQ